MTVIHKHRLMIESESYVGLLAAIIYHYGILTVFTDVEVSSVAFVAVAFIFYKMDPLIFFHLSLIM